MRKGLLLTALLAGSLLSANAEDYLKAFVKPASGSQPAQLSIRLVNADAQYTAFSFKVNLPDGLTFAEGAEAALSDRADASHQVKCSEVAEGAKTMTIAVFSYKEEGTTKTGNKNFSETEGEILTIPVVADNAFFTNAFTVGTDGDNLLAEVEFVTKETDFVGKALNVTKRAKMGDANGDGAITLDDASVVVNHFKKRALVTSPEIFELVDIDGQGGLTLNDASSIVNAFRKRF